MIRDTITALTTPLGKSSVAVLRLSGSNDHILKISNTLFKKEIPPRVATLSSFFDENDQVIDEGLVLYFPEPNSFTGESVLEFQGHGNPVIISQLFNRLHDLGVRLARPGEFSERAFLNGKLDLVQAEAIADLIEAGSVRASHCAMQSLQGRFSERIRTLVDALIHLRMYVEAALDFSEEEIDFLNDTQFLKQLEALMHQVDFILKRAEEGRLVRDGIRVVIAGKPNAGKSSLLNALIDDDAAIVTDVPGTTRDVLKREMHLDGLPLHIVDTAGLHETTDKVEQEGIRRARLEIDQADVILYVADASCDVHEPDFFNTSIPVICVLNKIDLLNETGFEMSASVLVSARTGFGLDDLKKQIKETVHFHPEESEGLFLARARHLKALRDAKMHLCIAHRHFIEKDSMELLAEELRLAQLSLNEITGEFTSDDLLSKIFSSFCIGK